MTYFDSPGVSGSSVGTRTAIRASLAYFQPWYTNGLSSSLASLGTPSG